MSKAPFLSPPYLQVLTATNLEFENLQVERPVRSYFDDQLERLHCATINCGLLDEVYSLLINSPIRVLV
jgi:hypothetical protein